MEQVRSGCQAVRSLGMGAIMAVVLAACGGGGGQDGNAPPPTPTTPVSQRSWTAAEALPEGVLLHGPTGPLFAVHALVDGLGQPWTLQVRPWVNGAWGTAQVVHAFSFRRFPPDYKAAIDAAGNLYVMWADNGVQLRRFDARSGQWGSIQQVGSGGEASAWPVALQATRDGGMTVAWANAGQTLVTGWSSAGTLSSTHTLGTIGPIRFDDQGRGLAVHADGARNRIVWSRYTAASGWTQPQALDGAADRSETTLSVAAADGSVWRVVHEASGPTSDATTTFRLLAQRYDPVRGWQPLQVVSDSQRWQRLADVDLHPEAGLILSWQQGPAALGKDLMTKAWSPSQGWQATQRLAQGLSLWVNGVVGAPITPEVGRWPQVAMGPGGAALAAWLTCDRAPDPEPLLSQYTACTVRSARVDNVFAAGATWSVPQAMTSSPADNPITQFDVEDLHFLAQGDALLVRRAPPEGRVLQRLRNQP